MTLDQIVNSQKEFFNSNTTRSVSYRRHALERLLHAIRENESSIYAALKEDLNKSEEEAYLTEVSTVTGEIKYALNHIDSWARMEKVHTPLKLYPAKSYIVKEPYGVALIISPWNYPFQLAIAPLIGAIAAGNCAVIKPSKSSPVTSQVLANIINTTFEKKYLYVLEQNYSYAEILDQPYDYIFFTGSERAGKQVMSAAADRLIPVTLELGGKSPCIVDKSADIDLTARKIMWGKVLNAGQTCVAPDYVVVHSSIKEELVLKLREYCRQMVGDISENTKYPHIINLHHFMRLRNYIEREEHVLGGRCDEDARVIEPAIFTEATFDSPVMKEEIFGPILPIIEYENLDDVIDIIKHRAKPLACYMFGQSNDFIVKVINELSFGGGCINDVIIHVSNEHAPFGGVGASGMGHYHGKASFDTFTHEKSIVGSRSSIDIEMKYPPYTRENYQKMRKLLK